KKTDSVTLRTDASVIDGMQAESQNREVSLNVLVNQVLKRHVEWDEFKIKVGMMSVPKVMLSSLFDRAIGPANSTAVKDIERYRYKVKREAASIAFGLIRESVLFMKKHYNLWVVLEEYMKVSGINSDHRLKGSRRHVFLIQHELGKNGSLLTKQLLTQIFE